MSEYRKLDLNKLNYADTPILYDEAVINSVPFKITSEIKCNKNTVTVTNAEKDYINKCVKLEILF